MTQSGGALPYRGSFLEPWQQLNVVTETWPIEPGQRVFAVVTTNNWATTQEYEFSFQQNINNNSRWTLNLGPWTQGSQVQFYIRGTKTGQANALFDNNNSANFGIYQRPAPKYRSGAILQWFATDYKTIMARLPEVVEAGYSAIYLPSPVKGGVGGFSAGYDPVDRFDLGDRLQKNTVRTNFGTTQELQELIRVAKRFGLEVYCDLVINHNANRANHPINQYPDMIPEDFHIKSSADTSNTEINFNNESAFTFGMLNHDLVGLTDIAPEDGNNTQTGAFTLPAYASNNVWGKPSFVRQPTVPQLYPSNTPVAEDVREFLERWVKWLSGSIGFDGYRIDAVKHMPPGYFGWAPDQAASQGFSKGNLFPNVLSAYSNTYLFGEIYSSNSYELREYAKTGTNLLDFPMFFNLKNVMSSNGFGDLSAALASGYGSDPATGLFYQQGGLSPDLGVTFAQSHDDGPPTSSNLSYAFILGRPGRAKVYYDGNNIQPGNWSNFPKPGRFDALGNGGDTVTKLVNANSRFGRGYTVNRYTTSNCYVFERQVNGRGVMIVGLNSRGDNSSQTVTFNSGFTPGVILEDLSGQRPNVTVGASGSVTLTIPSNYSATEANNGKGYVMYAPKTPKPVTGSGVTAFQQIGTRMTPVAFGTNSMPAGQYSTSRTFSSATVTSNTLTLRLRVDSASGAVVRINNGMALPGKPPLSNTPEGLSDGCIPMDNLGGGVFEISNMDISALPDGLNLFKIRAYADTGSDPGAFTDFNTFIYINRGLGTKVVINGDLAEFPSSPLSTQFRNPSSNANRIDGLYAMNDDRYVYLGLAGRVDGNEGLVNGMGLAIDIDGSGAGVRDLSTLNDDSGPATRLISNTRITLPPGMAADYMVGAFRNSSMEQVPEAPFAGGLVTPFTFGAQAGLYKINSSNLRVLNPLSASLVTDIRANKTDPAKGVEIAIPIRTLFSGTLTSGTGMNLVAWLGSTGESNSFLASTDPLRGTLGGRPAPSAWLSNQFLPSQSNIASDPGTSAVSLLSSARFNLSFATASNAFGLSASTPVLDATSGQYSMSVVLTNNGATSITGPISLRMSLPSGVVLVNKTDSSLTSAGKVYQTASVPSVAAGATVRFDLKFTAPNAAAITPTYEVMTGPGVL